LIISSSRFKILVFEFFKNMLTSWVGFRAVVLARFKYVHGHIPLCRPLCSCLHFYRTTFFVCGHTPLCRPLCPLTKNYPLKSPINVVFEVGKNADVFLRERGGFLKCSQT
jgi:hypothetical protein